MRKKIVFSLLTILAILFLIPVSLATVDRIRFNKGESPIFAKDYGNGCEQIIFEGIGYDIVIDCPLTTSDDNTDYAPYWKWFWD